jgi:hypothetical protein
MSAAASRNFGIGHAEFPVTPTLTARVIFTDSVAANPQIDHAAAVTHLENVIAQLKAEAAEIAASPEPAPEKSSKKK